METILKWEKINDHFSRLIKNGELLAEFFREDLNSNFKIRIDQDLYTISDNGTWRRSIEIKDEKNRVLIHLQPNKWYSTEFSFTYEEEGYRLLTRNNPLAEFVIQKDKKDVLAYALDSMKDTKKLAIRINESPLDKPILFHVLLWYFFRPIAIENSIDFQWWMWGIS